MKVLVLYYSQSGQLKEILDAMLKPLAESEAIILRFEALVPKPAYPFPWGLYAFLDVFPESFQEVACDMAPLEVDPDEAFDLVILAYTVWYLSPSIPISTFLQSPMAKKVLKDRPVVTVIGCRNMWLMAQEKVKQRIADAGGRLKGNIVLGDRAMNLVGVATIVYWMLTGKKERPFKLLPKPGISDGDIQNSQRFGPLLAEPAFLNQDQLNALGAVHVVPAYILFEKRIQKVFEIWSAFIRQKGGPADPRRRIRVRLFFYYLLVAIILIAPLATIATLLVRILKREKLRAAVAYFSHNALKPGP
jgi:hypothetical protein